MGVKRILVLGGNGFVGKHLIQQLVSHGHKVKILIRSKEETDLIIDVEYVFNDFSLIDNWDNILHDVDYVCHLISLSTPSSNFEVFDKEINNNLRATLRLLQSMNNLGIKKILFLSSGGSIYGMQNSKSQFDEKSITNPKSFYGLSKLLIEQLLHFYAENYKFKILILRPSNIYGPGQKTNKPQGVIGHFLNNHLNNRPSEVWGNGEAKKNYVYVIDLAKIIQKLIKNEVFGTLNIGSGKITSINEIILIIKDTLNIDLNVKYIQSKEFDVDKVELSNRKLLKSLKDFEFYPLNKGIKDQFQYLLKNHGSKN